LTRANTREKTAGIAQKMEKGWLGGEESGKKKVTVGTNSGGRNKTLRIQNRKKRNGTTLI